MHDDASWMLSRIPIASSRSWKRVNDEFFTDYTVSMFELVRTSAHDTRTSSLFHSQHSSRRIFHAFSLFTFARYCHGVPTR